MNIFKEIIDFESKIQTEFIDITEKVEEIIEKSGIRSGQVLVFSPHNTMSIVINHNEKMLNQDLTNLLYKLCPIDDKYSHDLFEIKKSNKESDGRSNGHSHCKAILLGNSETIPVNRGKMILSNMQSIFAVELDGARKRDIVVQVIGV